MKNKFKILSLALSIIMISTAFSSALASSPTLKNGATHAEAVEYLKKENYIKGYEDGSLGENRNITRAEIAALMTRVLGGEKEIEALSAKQTKFSDTDKHWSRGYVNYASNKEIIKGYPDGTFKPEENISYAECIAMMIRTTGLISTKDEATAVFPTTYISKATEVGLLQGIVIKDYNEKAVRGTVFDLLYNQISLQTPDAKEKTAPKAETKTDSKTETKTKTKTDSKNTPKDEISPESIPEPVPSEVTIILPSI